MKKLLRNRSGTAEIVGTVLFLVILFFFFSNVFLWYNQASGEMNQELADKANSAVIMENVTLPGTAEAFLGSGMQVGLGEQGVGQSVAEMLTQTGYSLAVNFSFSLNAPAMESGAMEFIADLRLSINASYEDPLNEPCFVYVLDCNQSVWVNTGLTVTAGYKLSSTILSPPNSYMDSTGTVKIRIADASSQLGYNDTAQGVLNIDAVEVYADPVALQVTDLGGTDAALSRLWIDSATNHTSCELDSAVVSAGSTLTIMFSCTTDITAPKSNYIVVDYVPPTGQIVTFSVLTTLGNTAACTYDFS